MLSFTGDEPYRGVKDHDKSSVDSIDCRIIGEVDCFPWRCNFPHSH